MKKVKPKLFYSASLMLMAGPTMALISDKTANIAGETGTIAADVFFILQIVGGLLAAFAVLSAILEKKKDSRNALSWQPWGFIGGCILVGIFSWIEAGADSTNGNKTTYDTKYQRSTTGF